MQNMNLAVVVHLCSELLRQVATDLNGGKPFKIDKSTQPHGLLLTQTAERLVRSPTKSGKATAPRGVALPRTCAIIGCNRPNRTKGYCAAHYQKLRMLTQTDRRPAAWKDHAAAWSVEDIKLPRGRAGSKALAEHQQAQLQAKDAAALRKGQEVQKKLRPRNSGAGMKTR